MPLRVQLLEVLKAHGGPAVAVEKLYTRYAPKGAHRRSRPFAGLLTSMLNTAPSSAEPSLHEDFPHDVTAIALVAERDLPAATDALVSAPGSPRFRGLRWCP